MSVDGLINPIGPTHNDAKPTDWPTPLIIITEDDTDYIWEDAEYDWPRSGNYTEDLSKSNQLGDDDPYSITKLDNSIPIREIHIDMDNTIGDISAVSLYIAVWQQFQQKPSNEFPPYSMFADWFFEKGAWRPYLKDFFKYLEHLKHAKKITTVYINTSVINNNGYVDWIVKCLEIYCDTSGVVDGIEDGRGKGRAPCGATIKVIQPNAILIDDKPWNVRPANRVLGVSAYRFTTSTDELYKFFDSKHHEQIREILNNDAQNFPQYYSGDNSSDDDLKRCIQDLKTLF